MGFYIGVFEGLWSPIWILGVQEGSRASRRDQGGPGGTKGLQV